jgi:molybdopterin-guanine dinucleotide biosynthesis protein A
MHARGVTGVVLAGGQGRRMGSIDKGLVLLQGRPMVQHVLERLRPQVDEILINANQHRAEYEAFGHPVFPDAIAGFAGPLAGLQVGLTQAKRPLVATVPCDSPFLPADLVARLAAALEAREADLAVARTFEQPHPVFALVRRTVLPHLTRFREEGGRKIDAWYATLDRRSPVRRRGGCLPQHQYSMSSTTHPDAMSTPKTLREASCADDYDPNSMPVPKARADRELPGRRGRARARAQRARAGARGGHRLADGGARP